jgi:hypothetical protein
LVAGESYVGDYGYDRRVNRERPGALMAFLRDYGYRPPGECQPGLHEYYLPNIDDAWLVLESADTLNGTGGVAWLPRIAPRELGGGSAESWGRGHWYKPMRSDGLFRDEFSPYRFSADYLVGVEFVHVVKLFGQKLGRAMRWNLRHPGRALYVTRSMSAKYRWWDRLEKYPRSREGVASEIL